MESFIFVIGENTVPFKKERIHVRATEAAIRVRMYAGGFLRFVSSCLDYAKNYPIGTKINGQEILSLHQFDEWRKQHYCC